MVNSKNSNQIRFPINRLELWFKRNASGDDIVLFYRAHILPIGSRRPCPVAHFGSFLHHNSSGPVDVFWCCGVLFMILRSVLALHIDLRVCRVVLVL